MQINHYLNIHKNIFHTHHKLRRYKRNKQIREREEEDDREAVITQSLQNAELRLRFANVRILGGKFSLSNTSTPISPEC